LTSSHTYLSRQNTLTRAPFIATPRGSARGIVPPASGSRRSDPGQRQNKVIQGPLGPIPNPRPSGPNFGVSGYGGVQPSASHGYGTVTPVFGTRQSKENMVGAAGVIGGNRMRGDLAQMQKRMNGGAEVVRERQPLASLNNIGNARGSTGGGFGLKNTSGSGIHLRSKDMSPFRGDSDPYADAAFSSRYQHTSTTTICDVMCSSIEYCLHLLGWWPASGAAGSQSFPLLWSISSRLLLIRQWKEEIRDRGELCTFTSVTLREGD
jgi:hypothetical protein